MNDPQILSKTETRPTTATLGYTKYRPKDSYSALIFRAQCQIHLLLNQYSLLDTAGKSVRTEIGTAISFTVLQKNYLLSSIVHIHNERTNLETTTQIICARNEYGWLSCSLNLLEVFCYEPISSHSQEPRSLLASAHVWISATIRPVKRLNANPLTTVLPARAAGCEIQQQLW